MGGSSGGGGSGWRGRHHERFRLHPRHIRRPRPGKLAKASAAAMAGPPSKATSAALRPAMASSSRSPSAATAAMQSLNLYQLGNYAD